MNERNRHVLDFEKPLIEIEEKIENLERYSETEKIGLQDEIARLRAEADRVRKEIFFRLTPWQRIQLARHPDRPYFLDYVSRITREFIELHGDRLGGDDQAIVAGVARIDAARMILIGQQKGRDTKENLRRNFGSPHPEGYRKAARLMKLADKFRIPLVCLIDTPGAYPGVGAEERGQAHAIAENIRLMMELRIPIITVIIGEGGSGGALGIGVGDLVYVMENAYYSVISPEGCAAILWKSKENAPEAAAALKLTPRDLLELKLVDGIIPEPLTGAHRDWDRAAAIVKETVINGLKELEGLPSKIVIHRRQEKYRRMGIYGQIGA
ncbi:MAG: acetyl-CoA carboxylase carboxyltransferase subunit alpha [Candidatus Aureabacteria bacterium]|nr:acetyl-CoA carboxylase carboxyltransferase subunit alpha [Candidatus Auribacterota bacterium]